ncbi:DsrE family protein [Erythrobacter sp.]|uniref:DsrE family protein n=1 Tax=Erythrobacter sp. TaxID=1042 RepID=UPI001B1C6691|nr:DsrE family protein [Erythrobacter sp.]MBO6527803.1 DsrE family protein [Erythrobacter sp.]MBO6531247.1 DsrE family protein [Erythrobacter sp.]
MRVTILRYAMTVAAAALVASAASAQDMSAFETGPVFEDFGPHAPVEGVGELTAGTAFKHSFDVSEAASEGKGNRHIERAARFINMHAAAGVDPHDIEVAVVVHGGASLDLLGEAAWEAQGKSGVNASHALVRDLLDEGVRMILCGQSAAAHGIAQADLIPGVEIALSAMTAHALLQRAGYTVNPF